MYTANLQGSALIATALITIANAACSSTSSTSQETPSNDAGTNTSFLPPNCDLTKSPKDSPDCVDNGVGIFVDASGKPDGAGTKLDPVSKIATAISKAITSKKPRIYICDGTYAEPIKLASAVSVYGGFDCKWNNTGVKPKVVPTSEPAIQVKSVSDLVIIQDLEATGASDATMKGSSAIGALIVHSKVTLRALTLTAGAGQPGAKGASESNWLGTASAGATANAALGGQTVTCTCADGSSSVGGHGNNGDGNGGNPGSSNPVVTTAIANDGASSTTTCTDGSPGANGEIDVATDPVATPGVLVETGWDLSKVGTKSKNGHPAQGGGGAGAKKMPNQAGGGGGCGGCGGAGAHAGLNGGASIGLISFAATVTFESGTIVAGEGAKGGNGGDGQPGQAGAGGGTGACTGGLGGVGAGGNAGAGGAGGDSIAVAWGGGGTEPSLSAVDARTGGVGSGGEPGTPGGGSGTLGAPGKAGNPGQLIPNYHQQ